MLNDFLQAGRDYVRDFMKALNKIELKNPIAFEFFKPPAEEFFEYLNEHLNDYSVEISVESHDDGVRAAFGKKHYTMDQVEDSIKAALKHGCKRFDLYFMTGIPEQTAQSVIETGEYVGELYKRIPDPRLLAFISPMAPFLDPGSLAFDNPEKYGYTLRAKTLEEHRQRLVQPSWKHIMNYESHAMTPDEMVDSTYEASILINRAKAEHGIIDAKVAVDTERRIVAARDAMHRIDQILEGPAAQVESRLIAFKAETEALNESTVVEKSQLEWPRTINPRTVVHVIGLWARENMRMLLGSQPTPLVPALPIQPTAQARAVAAAKAAAVPAVHRPTARLVARPGTRERRGLMAPAPDPSDAGRPTTERVRGIFSSIAEDYDAFNRLASLGIDKGWRREMVRAARLDRRSRVVDLCSGTGDVALAIADQAAPAEIVATDFTPEMLAVAEKKAVAYTGPTQLEFEWADAQDLPFDDDSFDVATVAFGVRNLPDRAANFREVAPRAQAGGSLRDPRVLPPDLRAVARGLPRLPAGHRAAHRRAC